MNCTIKKVRSSQQTAGTSIGLLVFTSQYENEPVRYCYTYAKEKFERPTTQFAFEVWISYALKGRPVQHKVACLHYYDLAEGVDWKTGIKPEEWERVLADNKTDPLKLETLIENKLAPLKRDIQTLWLDSAEGKAQKKMKETLARHHQNKKNFEAIWGAGTYDFIYDVFGNLKNEEFLHWLQAFNNCSPKNKDSAAFRYKKSQKKKQRPQAPANSRSYAENEKVWLKKFYRTLAREYHPDSGGETEAMILINKLKEDWDI